MQKIKYIQIGLAALLMFVFSNCYYDQIIDEPVELSDDTEVSFQLDVIPIFNASCNSSGCHNAGEIPPDLTAGNAYNALVNGNYIDISTPENSELYKWMRGQKDLPMPLTGPDATYNATILKWIQQGAANN